MMKRYLISIVVFLISLVSFTQQGLVAHWKFDSLYNDTIKDHSINAFHGTNYGAHLIDGIKGRAISFNGTSDYVRIPEDGQTPPDTFAELDSGTISFWFKARTIPTNYGIAPLLYYGAEDSCDFFDAANKGLIVELGHSPIHYGSERLYFTMWKNGCTYPSFCYDSWNAIPTDKWQHIVIVVGKDYNTGYLNGSEMTDRTYNFGDASYSQFFADAVAHEKMWLGKGHWDRTIQYYDGAIDEMKIFNKPLSSSEVQDLFKERDTITTAFIHPNVQKKVVEIFPNPVSGTLFYQIDKTVDILTEIKITNICGKVVMNNQNPPSRGRLDTSYLPPGTYYVSFNGNEYSKTKKIFILND